MVNNRKGYAILESAIVMPTIIFILIFLIFFNFLLFSLVLEKSKVQRAVRMIAGEKSKTVYYLDSKELTKEYKWEIKKDGILVYERILIINSNEYKSKIFRNLYLNRVDEAEATIFNESSFLRNLDLIVSNLNTKKGEVDEKQYK